MSQVGVVGNLARDRIDGGAVRAGGCPFFGAVALHLLDRQGQILTRCADVDLSFFSPQVAALGLPTTILSARQSAGFDHRYDGERRSTTVTSIGDPWTPADAAHLDRAVQWLHVAPLLRSDFPAETLAALASQGRRVSLDGQGLVRSARLGPLVQDAQFDWHTLASISVLKLSEEEATIVARGPFTAEVARALGVPENLVTLGSRGEDLYVSGTLAHVSTTPVLGVETTGAGDAFMVAYVASRGQDVPPADAARQASALVVRMLEQRKCDLGGARATL